MPAASLTINQGHPVGYTEIYVDDYSNRGLSEAMQLATITASATNQVVVHLVPGTYTLTSVLTVPSYTSLVGAGRDATIITRTVNLANSVDTSYDPVVNANSTTGVRIKDLTINAAAADQSLSGSPTSGPVALVGSNSVGLVVDSCRLVGTFGGGYEATDTAATTTFLETSAALFKNSELISYGLDAAKFVKANGVFLGCFLLADFNSSTPQNSGHDVIALSGGYLRMVGCDIRNVITKTINSTAQGTNMSCVMLQAGTAGINGTVWLDGCTLLLDIVGGDINQSAANLACVDNRLGTSVSDDSIIYANGCQFHYRTGTITSAKSIGGLIMGQTGDNAQRGQAFLSNVEIRDLAGSGGTNRADVLINMTGTPSTKISKKVATTNCRISSYKYINVVGSPSLTHSNYMATEQGPNYMTGSSVFASAATAAGTLPFTYPSNSSGVTDYLVGLEPSLNETFWVTAKTNSGFTLNSSNATSTATVNWLVRR